jgi:hypothetical protein
MAGYELKAGFMHGIFRVLAGNMVTPIIVVTRDMSKPSLAVG